jgi:glycosyltransferase involved in cell wall biosynthesis
VSKLRVLFVATVEASVGGATGGQAVAATALIASGLARTVELELLSKAPPVVPPPALPRRAAKAIWRLFRFVRRIWSADVVLVFAADAVSLLEKGWMCILARLARRGVVLRISGGSLPAQCDARPMLRAWLRLVLKSTHVVCTQSKHWTAYFGRYVERDKLIEVSNGIELGDPPVAHPPGDRMVFVGWVTREKGVFEALDVLEGVRAVHPSATLTVVGGGRDLQAFTGMADSRGLGRAARTTGWLGRHEVRGVLGDSDVFLFPSHSEGLPNAVIEAMAAGLPVVATKVGGVPDLIRHKHNGFLVEVGDVAGMTARINELLARPDEAREIGRRGRQTVVERCDIERVWPRYAQAIREAAAQAGRPRAVVEA